MEMTTTFFHRPSNLSFLACESQRRVVMPGRADLPAPPGAWPVCPGHLDLLALCSDARGRRDKPGDDGGTKFETTETRGSPR
jgi:hypothetical protein